MPAARILHSPCFTSSPPGLIGLYQVLPGVKRKPVSGHINTLFIYYIMAANICVVFLFYYSLQIHNQTEKKLLFLLNK